MKMWMAAIVIGWGVASSAGSAIPAQRMTTDEDWCRDENWGRDREGVCEVREFTVAAQGAPISVDASPNGGIKVDGESRSDVHVRAKVTATAASEARARDIANAVRINQAADRIEADGPDRLERREGWSVSYRLAVPQQSALSLRTTNGGISISAVDGRIEFRTTNGGVTLKSLAGDVRGRTTNGGIKVELDGATWRGEGLDVETNNGGVNVAIPDHYSARLETGTVNGRLNLDFPVTVQGRIDREITADLGGGGPTIRVKTSNGGVRITRK
jgi:hypothetical protein